MVSRQNLGNLSGGKRRAILHSDQKVGGKIHPVSMPENPTTPETKNRKRRCGPTERTAFEMAFWARGSVSLRSSGVLQNCLPTRPTAKGSHHRAGRFSRTSVRSILSANQRAHPHPGYTLPLSTMRL